MSSPLSRTPSLDTVSIEGLDVLSLDSETTENFILKLDAGKLKTQEQFSLVFPEAKVGCGVQQFLN